MLKIMLRAAHFFFFHFTLPTSKELFLMLKIDQKLFLELLLLREEKRRGKSERSGGKKSAISNLRRVQSCESQRNKLGFFISRTDSSNNNNFRKKIFSLCDFQVRTGAARQQKKLYQSEREKFDCKRSIDRFHVSLNFFCSDNYLKLAIVFALKQCIHLRS
jgi:hypothetical protein